MMQKNAHLQPRKTPLTYSLGISSIPTEYIPQGEYWQCPLDDSSMVLVAGGPFWMGNDAGDAYCDEKPVHEVYVAPFLLDVHKVSRESYRQFLQALEEHGGHHPDWCHPYEPHGKSHIPMDWDKQKRKTPFIPVSGVDWYDAWAYAAWAGKRIPTEAQWEKASYPEFIVHPSTARQRHPLNMRDKGWEWCMDWYQGDYYLHSPRKEPCCMKRTGTKSVRGNIRNITLPLPRSSFRNRFPCEHRDEYLGFRCAKPLLG